MRALPVPPVQLITGEWNDVADLSARVSAALRGGIRWIQLRSKTKAGAVLHEAALVVAPLVADAGGLFVMNDRVDVALAAGAGGVHLPENGISSSIARRILGADAWIARSLHSVDGIRDVAEWVDAVQFGPVYETASKREHGAPQGIDALARAADTARAVGLNLLAVGGIDPERARECLAAGANAVSIIGAVWDAADIEEAARRFVVTRG